MHTKIVLYAEYRRQYIAQMLGPLGRIAYMVHKASVVDKVNKNRTVRWQHMKNYHNRSQGD